MFVHLLRVFGLLSIGLLLAGCGMEPQWKELKLPGDSIRIQMPAKWTEQTDAEGQRIYKTTHGRTEYLLSVGSIGQAANSVADARNGLRAVRDKMVSNLPGGKLDRESEIELEGHPGIELQISGDNQIIAKARVFLKGHLLVTTLVDYQAKPTKQDHVDKYLNSLSFNLDAPISTGPGTPPAPPPPGSGSAPASTGGEDTRKAWRYTNAPKIFPDQKGYNGLIKKMGDKVWVDETETGPLDFIEENRTPEYVELKRPVGDFRVRLYNDHSEYKFGYSPQWEQMFPGKWE